MPTWRNKSIRQRLSRARQRLRDGEGSRASPAVRLLALAEVFADLTIAYHVLEGEPPPWPR